MIIDTNSNCAGQIRFLVERGVEVVGRYYSTTHPHYALTHAEARALSAAGIEIFTVFEDQGHADRFHLTEAQGAADAGHARDQAAAIGQPAGSAIYFAVEGLPNGYDAADLPGVRAYFAGVAATIGGHYSIGVYGDGLVCQTLLDEGICTHTWLAQASYSFPGSQAFYRSKRWNLAQIVDDLTWNGLSVDINEGLGEIGAFRL